MSIQPAGPVGIGVGVPPEAGRRQSRPPPLTIRPAPSGVHSGAAYRCGESRTTFGAEPSISMIVIRLRVASRPIHGASAAGDPVARSGTKAGEQRGEASV